MFIQIESTPNPSTLKFIPGQVVLMGRTLQINNQEQAKSSPLAEKLFEIEGIKAIFLGHDFISVSKLETISWEIIQPDILSTIMDHYLAGKPMTKESKTEVDKPVKTPVSIEDEAVIAQIKELIETKVRPAVAQDGGDIIFHGFEHGVVKLELHGACSGCPSSTITLKNGIENMLKYYVPEVESVEAVEKEE